MKEKQTNTHSGSFRCRTVGLAAAGLLYRSSYCPQWLILAGQQNNSGWQMDLLEIFRAFTCHSDDEARSYENRFKFASGKRI